MERDIEQEAHRIYERMKIRRIRDYSDLKLNEDEDEGYDEDGLLRGGVRNDNYNGLNENKSLSNTGKEVSKKFSYDSDNEENFENGVLIKKTNSKSFSSDNGYNKYTIVNQNNINNFLNKNRNSENEENKLVQTEIKKDQNFDEQTNNHKNEYNFNEEKDRNLKVHKKKKSIFDKIDDEKSNGNSSDDADSIEKDFEKNKEIFNFSGPNTKLKISKETNLNNRNYILNRRNKSHSNSKPTNFMNPKPLTKTNLNLVNKLITGNKDTIACNKSKVTGLSSLISNYSNDDLSQ